MYVQEPQYPYDTKARFAACCRERGGKCRVYEAPAGEISWACVRECLSESGFWVYHGPPDSVDETVLPADTRFACYEVEVPHLVQRKEAADALVDPHVKFIGRNPERQISIAAIFPRYRDAEYKVSAWFPDTRVITFHEASKTWIGSLHSSLVWRWFKEEHPKVAIPEAWPDEMYVKRATAIVKEPSDRIGDGELVTPLEESLRIIREGLGWRHIEL